jgi:glycosyltransferase involved in cell wall biosynthesis
MGRTSSGAAWNRVLSQDFTDLELLIRDNVSDDGTVSMLQDYARSDPPIALSVNDANVGSHENMRVVFQDARGTLFRWISADDWLEPGCLSECVR